VAKIDVRNLGDYIREQRSIAEISLRQLASQAGVSNPYLSQIERGLRKPSAEILQQIAKALRISAEALYIQAGILEERYGDSDVPAAILSDTHLADRAKQVLLELYEAYRRDAETQQAAASASASPPAPSPPSAAATPKSATIRTTRTARRAAAPPTSAPSTPPAPSTPRRSDARSA
jgi:transcriptional regulator with XRE-family HTH domain